MKTKGSLSSLKSPTQSNILTQMNPVRTRTAYSFKARFNIIRQSKDSNNTGVHCDCQRPREDKILFAQIQINRQPDVPLQ